MTPPWAGQAAFSLAWPHPYLSAYGDYPLEDLLAFGYYPEIPAGSPACHLFSLIIPIHLEREETAK